LLGYLDEIVCVVGVWGGLSDLIFWSFWYKLAPVLLIVRTLRFSCRGTFVTYYGVLMTRWRQKVFNALINTRFDSLAVPQRVILYNQIGWRRLLNRSKLFEMIILDLRSGLRREFRCFLLVLKWGHVFV